MSGKQRFNKKRKGRSLQRQRALDILFEADTKDLAVVDIPSLLAERQEISTAQQPIGEYGISIVQNYVEYADDIDSMIEAASVSWAILRMGLVDRNLLRIGATEYMYMGIELPIVIHEITALARDLSSDKAVSFIMGILNRIGEIRDLETSGNLENNA